MQVEVFSHISFFSICSMVKPSNLVFVIRYMEQIKRLVLSHFYMKLSVRKNRRTIDMV